MLSPSEGHDAFRVDLYWWKYNLVGDANKYFGLFYEKLSDVPGIRYHWGKHLPRPSETYGSYTFQAEDLQRNYPMLSTFLAWREKMDPQQLFVTDYWRDMLSIPRPELEYKKSHSTVKTLFSRTVVPTIFETAGGTFVTMPTKRM